jgi:hypothetical protein
MVNTRNNHCNG